MPFADTILCAASTDKYSLYVICFFSAASAQAPVGSSPIVIAPCSRKKSSKLPSLQPISSTFFPCIDPKRLVQDLTNPFMPFNTSAVKRDL